MNTFKLRHIGRTLKVLGWRLYGAAVIIGILVGLGLALWPDKPPLPSAIKAQATSTILVPKGSGFHVNRSSAAFDNQVQLLSFVATGTKNVTYTISEQSAPAQFNDISGYYAQFANSLNSYSDFSTDLGHVYLIHPTKDTAQAGVIYAAGTLMFTKSSTPLSDDDWRKFFRSLVVLH